MSGKEIDFNKIIWSAVRTGAITMLTSLILLLPVSWMIYKGVVEVNAGKLISILVIGICAFITQMIVNQRWGGGGVIGALLGCGIMLILLLLLTASMKDARWNLSGMLPAAGAGGVGMLMGSLIKINKKYTRRNNSRRRYNK